MTDRRPAALSARALAVLGVALCATAARLPGVYDRPFWEDEVASARVLGASSLAAMLHRVTLTESTPPFWYALAWLVHLCDVPFRDERLLSVAFGAILSAAVVVLALRFVPMPLAVSAGLMVAFGGEFVSHGHELRAYELLALVSCLFGLALVRVLEAPALPRYAALAATVAVGGATHYFFAFSVLAILAWLWLDPRAHAVRRRATVAIAAGGAVAAVCTPIMVSQYEHDRFAWIGPFDLRYVLAVPLRLFTDAANGTSLGEALSAVTIIVVAIGCRRLASTAAGSAVAALAVVPVAAAALAWLAGSNTFDVRNLIGVGPFIAIAVTAAAGSLPRRVASIAAAATLVSLTVSLAIFGRDQLPRYDVIARALASAGWNAHSPIAVFGDPTLYESPLEWYLPGRPTLKPWHEVGVPAAPLFVVRRSGRVLVARRWSPHSTLVEGATLLIEPGVAARCQAPASYRPGECEARRRVGRG